MIASGNVPSSSLELHNNLHNNIAYHFISQLQNFIAEMGCVESKLVATIKYRRVEKDLDKKVAEALKERTKSKKKTFRNCLNKLQVQMSEEEIDNIHRYCDIDNRKGIQFPEFVVFLCLMYLLFGSDVTYRVSEFESARLNYVFDELIDAFLFFDKDGNGKMKRKDVTQRMNEATHQERTPSHITSQLFKEMDLNRNGHVNLKEFLLSIIRWAGVETDDDEARNETSP
uniref:EF-hand domain-containing protein n=1 Tax=Oryza glumipatula TaxID=40148 RepID=A0A0D9ZU67_9ORYZ